MKKITRYESGHDDMEMDCYDGCRVREDGPLVSYEDCSAIVAAKDSRIIDLELMLQKNAVKDGNEIAALQEQVRGLKERLQLVAELNDVASALHVEAEKKVRELAAEKENARDVMLYAANNISYAIFNLSDKKLSDLKRGLSDTTCPTDSALLAERELRSFAARIRAGEKS